MNMSPAPLVSENSAAGAATASRQPQPTVADVAFSQVLSGELAQQRSAANAAETTDKSPTTDSAIVLQAGTASGDAGKRVQPNDPAHEEIGTLLSVGDTPMLSPTELLALAVNLGLVIQKPLVNNDSLPLQPELPDTAIEAGADTAFPAAAASALSLLPEPAAAAIPDTAATIPVVADGSLPSQFDQLATAPIPDPATRIPVAIGSPASVPQSSQADPDRNRRTGSREGGMRQLPASAASSGNAPPSATARDTLPIKPDGGFVPTVEGSVLQTAATDPLSTKTVDLQSAKASDPLPTLANASAMSPLQQIRPEAAQTPGGLMQYRLAPPVGAKAWEHALGERITWMVAGAQQTASLTLNPPDLGPLQVVLSISEDQASANFFSAQPEVRQALEAALPKLREMMSEAGVQLGQTSVSADMPRQNDTADRQARQAPPRFPGLDSSAIPGPSPDSLNPQQTGRGLLDTYA